MDADLEEFRVRGAVLVGADRMVVWDTLARPEDMVGVGELAPHLPISVVYSHGDWDHVWGTGGLSRTPDEIIAHHDCLHRFLTELPDALEEKRKGTPVMFDGVRLMPPTRTFAALLTVELGGITLELHHLPGHTPDTIVGLVPEWGLFLPGDAVETPLPFLNPGTPIGSWAESLEGWSHRLGRAGTEPVVVPSHGPIGGLELLRENSCYLRDLRAGRTPPIPETLTPFYAETHTTNQTVARQQSSPPTASESGSGGRPGPEGPD